MWRRILGHRVLACGRARLCWLVAVLAYAAAAHAGDDAETLLRKGDVLAAFERAEARALERPDDIDAQELLVDLYLTLGRSAQAQAEWRDRAEAEPNNPDVHYLLGRATLEAEAAGRAFRLALRLDPNHARSHQGIAAIDEAAGRWKAAERGYTRAVSLDPLLGESWLGAVRVALQLDRVDDALGAARAGNLQVPNDVGLILVLAELEPDHAIVRLQRAIREHGDEVRLLTALAERQLFDGKSSEAQESALRAVAIDPTDPRARRFALVAREATNGWLDAKGTRAIADAMERPVNVAIARERVAAYPRSALALLLLGIAHEAVGNTDEALAHFEAAERADPSNVEVVARVGVTYAKYGRFDESLPRLTTASGARTWDGPLALALARVQVANGRVDDGLASVASFLKRHPFAPGMHVQAAQLALDAARPTVAYAWIREGLSVANDPALVAALVRVAPVVGRHAEAARLLDAIVAQTGNAALAEASRRLWERARSEGR